MDDQERRIRQRLKDDFPHYAAKCLKIRTKEGQLLPLILNTAQRHFHDKVEQQKRATGKVRAITVKGRQQGLSTYIEGRYYWLTTHRFGFRSFILTHDNDATNNLFEMAQRYHEHCPHVVRPEISASNAKELIFADIDSGYKLGTAGNKSVGRSSTIQLLHASEVAFWPNAAEHAKGIMQAVPNVPGTEIILESTANGTGNYFHQQWQMAEAGESEFIPIFIPWFWQREYQASLIPDFKLTDEEEMLIAYYGVTKEQLMWRRIKIKELTVGGRDGLKSFYQEYPNTPVEAFIKSGDESFIPPDIVDAARHTKVEPVGKLIIGIDPATTGNDRCAIIRRRTRCAYGLQTFIKKSPTELANIIHRIIIDESPDKVILDGAPAGGGAEIRDRLWQLGHREVVKSVLSSDVPFDQKLYINKRAEMWATMKAMIADIPFELPDNDELAADLCSVRLIDNDPHQRIKLEKKEDMKKRGIRSPDCAEALMLTCAIPEDALTDVRAKRYENAMKSINSSASRIDRLKKAAYGS